MTHPTNEEWMDYLYGELPPDRRRACDQHLSSCQSCQNDVARWQQTVTRLDEWEVPRPQSTITRLPSIAPWAIAAAAMIGIAFLYGFAIGKTQVDLDALTAEVRSQLQAEALTQTPGEKLSPPTEFTASQQDIESLRDEFQTTLANYAQQMASQLQATRHQQTLSLNQIKMELETVALVGEDRYRNSRSQLNALQVHAAALPQHLTTQTLTH